MSSQRFCLRWNNHQTNLLSVFDQLLHAETFTDVTLAVEGQYLKAHKMVLSACSPYFQAIFVNHPEKHPIVILKDVPFKDMKCLLDFMYRGEVSVDQDRLAAFLRVAESLRIKGLTEVNDDKPPPPTASLTSGGTGPNPNQPASQQNPNQQLQQQLAAAASRNTQLAALQQTQQLLQQQKQKSGQSMLLTNPLLGSALSKQKRKRDRPRKLSGSDTGEGEYDGYESDNLVQSSPDLLDVKMGTDGLSNSGDENVISRSEEHDPEDSMDTTGSPPIVNNNNNTINKTASRSPAPSGATAASATTASTNNTSTTTTSTTIVPTTNSTSNAKSSASSLKNENSMSELADNPEITIIPHVPRSTPVPLESLPENSPMEADDAEDADDDDDEDESDSELEVILPKFENSDDCTIIESIPAPQEQGKDLQQQQQPPQQTHQMQPNTKQQQQQLFLHQLQQQHLQNLQLQHHSLAKMRMIQGQKGEHNGDSNGGLAIGSDPEDQDLGSPGTPMSQRRTPSQDSFDEVNGNHSHFTPSRQPARRRARRKNLSPDDQAEALTEMSVRGLNLFRYASISDGVYQCIECAKENVQKTFKNKYSFQRHAFLYHEGAQRKVFPCPVCNKEFSRPDKMKNHLKTTHESYMSKSDPVYPMSYVVGAEQGQVPPTHATAKIESVLSAIQLQQHLNLQKELHNQQAKYQMQQQLISPKLADNGAPAIAVLANTSSQ